MRHSLKPALYRVTGTAGVGFETAEGTGFYVPTMFVEGACERARQEWDARGFVSAAIYEHGKCVAILDFRHMEDSYKEWR